MPAASRFERTPSSFSSSDRHDSPYTFKPGPSSSHSLLLSRLPALGQGRRVLDVGDGEGHLSRALAERGYRVVCLAYPGTGVVPVPAGIELIEVDLNGKRPSMNRLFPFVVCGDVLEHLRDPLNALVWLRDLLEPEGRLLASLPNSGHFYFRWNVVCGRFPAHDRGLFDRTHLHFYTWDGWRQLFTQASLQIEAIHPTTAPIGLALGWPQDHSAVRALESIGHRLARLWKTLFAYQFVVTARRREH